MKKLLIIQVVILWLPLYAYGYHVNVHEKITDRAVAASNIQQYLNSYLNISLNDIFKDETGIKWMELGSKWEDDSLTLRWLNHFYEPTTGQGLHIGPATLGDPSLQWAKTSTDNEWVWWIARLDYYRALTSTDSTARNNHFAFLFRGLGHIIHLVHDLAVPSHVRNDPHNAPFIGLPYDMYESYTRDNVTSLTYSGYPAVDITDYNSVDDFWINGGNGLAEYTNHNFYSKKTITTSDYPNPAPENTNYYADLSLLPITITTTPDNVNHNTFYVSGYGKQHLAALKYFTEEIFATASPSPLVKYKLSLFLDDRCHEEYAQYLVPRAVGYSAGLLNYFFRGTLEISAPDQLVYAIADGSATSHQFTTIKAKVLNTTPNESMGAGTLQAVARYKIRADYQPNLSTDPPTSSSGVSYSYSVSTPITITALDSTTPMEFTFDFTGSPIPAGVTDLYLQVIFKGTLGNETDTAVAVGMKDINEPMHVVVWNATDRFYLDRVLRTAEEIRSDLELSSRAAGQYIDPYDVTTKLAFTTTTTLPTTYQVTYTPLPYGRYGRTIILTDTPLFYMHVHRESTNPVDSLDNYWSVSGVVNEETAGAFTNTQVYTFRGVIQHEWTAFARYYPDYTGIETAPWPAPSNTSPYPATTINQ
jgi:hypothetical protein